MRMSNEAALILGLCGVTAAACLATHSTDPLWLLIVLIWIVLL